jgi:UDP-3-O-[3-hydroxymyristoyl] glucosamine N-acyltransferase
MRLSQLAELLGGILEGEDREIRELAAPGQGDRASLVVLRDPQFLGAALQSPAALLLEEGVSLPADRSALRVPSVQQVWPRVLGFFEAPDRWAQGIHPTALIEPGVELAPEVAVGPYTWIRSGARLGRGSTIGPFCYIGEGVDIGEETLLEAHVVVHRGTQIGPRCRILSGAILGVVGFGFQEGRRLPHAGRVVLEAEVELGAGTVIERSVVGETRIGMGSKLGGQCYVAHNCTIGRGVFFAGQVALAGSVIVEDGVILAGQVGVADHLRIGRGARVAAQSGVSKSIPPEEDWAGSPARPARRYWRQLALLDWLLGAERRLRRKLYD